MIAKFIPCKVFTMAQNHTYSVKINWILIGVLLVLWGFSQYSQAQSCTCNDYIYVNDESQNLTHKFLVNSSTGALTEIGNPWLPASIGVTAPHGIIQDLNGYLYIAEGATDGDIIKLDSDGTIITNPFIDNQNQSLGQEMRTTNFIAKDGYLYLMENENRAEILAIELCSGTLVGRMEINGGADAGPLWDIKMDDTYWYIASRGENAIYRGLLNINQFTLPASNSGSKLFDLQYGRPMGFTLDSGGNFYVVEDQNFPGSLNTPNIVKYNSSGIYITDIEENTTANSANSSDGQAGWWGIRGITYSSLSNRIYVGSKENCVTVFDTNLNEQTALNIGNPTNGDPKAIGIITECCPDNNVTINETVCVSSGNTTIFLSDYLTCTDVIAEGVWNVSSSVPGFTFFDCNNTVVISATSGCSTYTLNSNGTGVNSQCIAFTLTLELCSTCSTCLLSDAGISTVTCNNNSTSSNSNDDYLTFNLNPIGTDLGTTYTVSANNGATVSLLGGGAANGVTYGNSTSFRLQNGSADGTNYTITITDNDDLNCTISTTISENSCSNTCTLTAINESAETCNDNGSNTNPSDDYITFNLNPIGTNLGSTYSVSVNNGGVVTLLGGGSATGLAYNVSTPFRLQSGSADGTTYMITVTDDVDASCAITTMVMQNACSNSCIFNITQTTQNDCQNNGTNTDASDDYFTIDVNATATNGNTQYQAVLNANADGTGGTVLGVSNYNQILTLGNGTNGALGTFVANGSTVYTITLRDAMNNICHDEFITMPISSCNNCPAITNPSPAQTFCEGQDITSLSINTNATNSDQIEFVYFSTQQTGSSMYVGGTSLGFVSPVGGGASITNINFPTVGTYYVYTILRPTPIDINCRPFQEIIITVNALPDATLILNNPSICDGEDASIVLLTSEAGVTYQLRDDTDDSLVGNPIVGTGGDITLPITGLTPNTYLYNVLATNGTTGCQVELTNKSTVTVNNCDFPDFPPPVCIMPACHVIPMIPLVYFGAGVTADQPGNGDINADTDVDDGIEFPNNIRRNIEFRLPITFYNNTGNSIYIQGWIDWDGDTNFDADEQVANLTILFDGANLTQTISQPVSVPVDAVQNVPIATRFRISSDPIIIGSPCGDAACAADGEVEDYLFRVECPEEVCLPTVITIYRN